MCVEELVVDTPSATPVTAMRSTVLIALRTALRDAGHFEAYEKVIDSKIASELNHVVAGVWVPLQVVHAHYAACDALALPVREQTELGTAAAARIVTALVGTALRLAATAGTTPWGFLEQCGRFWGRGYAGSGLRVIKRGPKEAFIIVVENEIHQRSPFARYSFCGVCAEMFKPFCTRFFMKVEAVIERPHKTVRYLAQWV
jgi:hypothetical protein